MNWKEISKECPKAFYQLCIWMYTGGGVIKEDHAAKLVQEDAVYKKSPYKYFKQEYLTAYEDFSWHYRSLFDFFDDQELFVEIRPDDYGTWYADILKKDPDFLYSLWFNTGFETRNEAETAAFEKAFELLNQKLSR